MTFKRTLFALLAMATLPAVALAQPTPPPITPAPNTANIAVANFFNNGNDEDSVLVSLSCTTGSISPTSATLANGEGQVFVVSNIPVGPDNTCTLTQTAISGYDTSYLCDPTASIPGDVQCGNPGDLSTTSCSWTDVTADNVGYCAIYNDVAPVEVEVTKMWDITNAGAAGDDYSLFAEIIVGCDAEIMNDTWSKKGWSYKKFYLDDSDYTAGEATVTVMVYPDFEGNECFAVEDDVDSAVEVTSDCGSWNNGAMEVGVGEGDSCTITNTLFFEGIPTLNQYGMAIMVLLMLGVGFVGFRRFV
jgi:hypothetical protein